MTEQSAGAQPKGDRAVDSAALARLEAMIATDARQALAETRAALARVDRTTDRRMAASLLTLVGRILGLLDAHDEASAVLVEAIEIFRALDDRAGLSASVQELGTAAFRRGLLAEALDRVMEGHRLAVEAGDRPVALRALNRMAAIHATLRDYDAAIRLYRQAIEEGAALGTMIEQLVPACNLAQTYIIKVWESDPGGEVAADIDAAWAALDTARAVMTETHPSPYRMAMLNVLAQCQNLRGQSDAAIESCRSLLADAGTLGVVSMQACAHRELASAYVALGRDDEAAEAAQMSVDLFRRIRFVHETDVSAEDAGPGRGAARQFQGGAGGAARLPGHALAGDAGDGGAPRRLPQARFELEQAQREAALHRELAGELEKRNRALSEATHAAEAARDAKGAFLSMMGHELRSPLQAILGFSEVIVKRLHGPDALERYVAAAGDIHTAGRHLLKLINQILDYSKGEIGKLRLEEDIAQLSQIVKSAFKMVADQAQRGGVTLVNALDADFYLRVDELKLTQCLLNMLSNAVKFTPPGGEVAISARCELEFLDIRICDTGIGIPPEDIPKVFEPFGQGRNAVGREGTGLGIPLSKMLIELHGGTLQLDSEIGRGTTVHLRLPLDRLAALPEADLAGATKVAAR